MPIDCRTTTNYLLPVRAPPMTPETSSNKSKLALAIVALLVLSAGIAYYAGAQNASGGKTTSTQASLSSSKAGTALDAQVAQQAASPPANSTQGLSPEQIYSDSSSSVVTVQGTQQTNVSTFFGTQTAVSTILGSGFVVDYQNSMYVVTNYHVVDGVTNLTVTFSDGNAYPATVVGTDPYSDLAVVKVTAAPSSEFVPLQVVSSSTLVVGQPVYAIGNPFGLAGSMTAGIVSALGRTIQDPVSGNFSVAGVIQFSAPINPGNSGGPLFDTAGQVVGITTATVSSSQGIGFAIPSSTILKELPSLIANGTYSAYSYMGIGTVDMNYQLAQVSHTNFTYGVLVEDVVPGGPAAKAGIVAGNTTVTVDGSQYLVGGDIIVSINGTKIVNTDALSTFLVQDTTAGQVVVLGVIRSGTLTSVTMTLGTRPAA